MKRLSKQILAKTWLKSKDSAFNFLELVREFISQTRGWKRTAPILSLICPVAWEASQTNKTLDFLAAPRNRRLYGKGGEKE
jgi:hypothetical protein